MCAVLAVRVLCGSLYGVVLCFVGKTMGKCYLCTFKVLKMKQGIQKHPKKITPPPPLLPPRLDPPRSHCRVWGLELNPPLPVHLVNGTGNSPSLGLPTPGVVKQDKSFGGSVDTTKTCSDRQRVGMSSGERPIGAAKGKQTNTMASCQPPPPPMGGITHLLHLRFCLCLGSCPV